MTLSTTLYVPGHSWLHQLDPRVKLWATGVGIVLCFGAARLSVLLAVLAIIIATLLLGQVPAARILGILRSLLPFTILIILLQPWFFTSGSLLLSIGPLRLTSDGLTGAVLLALRANTLALLAVMPLLTTPETRVVLGMVKLGLPYQWGLTITLALRYLPGAAALFAQVRQAQEARGFSAGTGPWIQKARSFFPVLIAVIISSIRLSDQLALSMAVRGLGVGKRTTWQDFEMRNIDWLAMVLIGIAGTTILWVFH